MYLFYAYSEGDSAPYPINHLVGSAEGPSLGYFDIAKAVCRYAAKNDIGLVVERLSHSESKFNRSSSVFIPNETEHQYGDWYSLPDDDIPFPNLQEVLAQIDAIEFLKGD